MITTPFSNPDAFTHEEREYIQKTRDDLSAELQRCGIGWPLQDIEKFLCKHMKLNRKHREQYG
jgi:hypothetical protein